MAQGSRIGRRPDTMRVSGADGGRGVAEIGRHSAEWDALADRAGAAPFLRPGWVSAWWRAFGRGRLEILTSSGSGGRLDAVLPVVHRHGAIHAPSNWHTPQYGLLESGAGAGSRVVAGLFESTPLVSLGFLSSLLEDGGAHLGLKTGFDPEFRAMSPGRLIVHASLERAFAIGLERFEFMGTADAYKLRFANDAYDRVLFQAFSRKPAGRVSHAAFAYGRPVAKRMVAEAERLRSRVRS
jgi:CelD/BcsL family acetyltransferase involved in cellulose biosynthesis